MSKFVAGDVTKIGFFKKIMNDLFLNTKLAPKFLEKWFKDDVVTFRARTSERNYQTFNKIQAKSSFGRHVGGQEYALQHGGQYKSYYFVEKSNCHKISPF